MNLLRAHVREILRSIAAYNAADHSEDDPTAEPYDVAPTDGIPPSLSSALIEWVEHGHTPLEDVAQVVAWDVAEVARCLGRA